MTRRVECRVIESRIMGPVFDHPKPSVDNELRQPAERRKVARPAGRTPTHFCRAIRKPIGRGLMIDLRG